jgi:two-component system, NarL family, sensor kinase
MDGSSEYQVALLIAIGTVGMLLLAIAIVLFMVFYQKKMIQEQVKRQKLEIEYQHKMMQATLESQESERRKLASDLHDSIGGMLSTIRMGVSTLGRSLPDPRSVEQTKQMLDDTISSVRQISRDLMPSTLEKFGLAQALKELCERMQGSALMTINFHDDAATFSIDKNKELMLFRITQELLNNAIKHAQATEIKVDLTATNALALTVEDDGVGFNIDEQKSDKRTGKGLGLYSIENRASLLGAKLDFDKHRRKGSKITLTLPLYHEAEV